MGKDADEIPKSKIGPVAKSWATFLKYGIKISDRDVANILKMLSLKVVPSSIVGFRAQLKKEALPIYELLIASLKRGKFIHFDETGAKINGEDAWCWKASNKTVCITHTDRSRGQRVVEEILGPEYDGVLISDFLSAYNKIKTKAKQKCLVHILRDLKKVLEYWREEDDEVIRYCGRLKSIFENAIKLYKEYLDKKWDRKYYTRRRLITESLKDFAFPNPDKKILNRFAKRLEKHNVKKLVYYEIADSIEDAIEREKQIKAGSRKKKIALIESMNPTYKDLYFEI
ncbi:MAG: transposase [Candidatus Omnitrophica bacterium]|nr:transposase [Candidatus Omnitrophota bacterium]